MKYPPSTSLLDERVLSLRLRDYQHEAVDILLGKLREGERRLHVVAPPGSGKTLIGIAFLQAAGLRTVILSPNAAIQAQWMDKYAKSTSDVVDTLGELWGANVRHLISHDPDADTPILSLTYQRMSVRNEDGDAHANVQALVALLRDRDFGLLILDECHHLIASWAEAIMGVLREHPMVVLGLTATPPADKSERERQAYLDLVGEVDYSIPLPAVVKDGNLAPWQDLVYLVHPDARELEFIRSRHESYHALLATLEERGGELPPLSLYVQDVLDSLRYRGVAFPSFAELLGERPSLAIAFARYAHAHGIPLPDGAPWLDEAEEPPRLDDIVLILQGYVSDVLSEADPRHIALRENVLAALHRLGYREEHGGLQRRASSIDRILALSSAKLPALRRIVTRELHNLGDAVRVLLLTDFETTQAGATRALHGILDPEAGGAVAAMRALTTDPATDVLDPVMLTGASILCDDDLAQRFIAELYSIRDREGWNFKVDVCFLPSAGADRADTSQPGDFAGEADSTMGVFEIRGSGVDWNTRTYVLMITELFDRGVTRCLIGTRGLLGEGWDSLGVNVLVDLTAVSAYVSVNQMHGRSLRINPGSPGKTANNWDIVTVLPEYERGFADWERFVRKHEHLFGLSDDGELERGIGHVHPLLTHVEASELTAALPLVNEDMLEKSRRRDEVYRAWRIGQPYEGRELPCLEFRPVESTPRVLRHPAASRRELERVVADFRLRRRRFHALTASLSGLALLGAVLIAPTLALPALFPAVLAGAVTAMLGLGLSRLALSRVRARAQSVDLDAMLRCYALAVRDTIVGLRETEHESLPDVQTSTRQDGSTRCWITSPFAGENATFTRAMNELFHPVQDQRYILRCEQVPDEVRIADFLRKQKRATAQGNAQLPSEVEQHIVPVPADFARKREEADVFLRCWRIHVGPAELFYTKRGAGAELLRAHLRQRLLSGRRFSKVLWR